jgi:hypothetical protein
MPAGRISPSAGFVASAIKSFQTVNTVNHRPINPKYRYDDDADKINRFSADCLPTGIVGK